LDSGSTSLDKLARQAPEAEAAADALEEHAERSSVAVIQREETSAAVSIELKHLRYVEAAGTLWEFPQGGRSA
jgi:hypothetical protein